MTSAPATLRAALLAGVDTLAGASVVEARLVAELLLAHALSVDRAYLYAHPERELTPRELARWRRLLRRARRHEPVAYLVHGRDFYGRRFYVDRRVLIPRPETETLVEAAIAWATGFAGRRGRVPVVADVGTGSGAIAVTLAAHLPEARVYATDVSPAALRVAARNARRHGVAGRVRWLAGDLLAPVPEPVDLLLANPPYVSDAEMAGLPPGIARFEPRMALAGGPDGLDLYRRLLGQAVAGLAPGAAIFLEVGSAHAEEAARLAARALPGARVDLLSDLAGHPRVVRVLTGDDPPRAGSAG